MSDNQGSRAALWVAFIALGGVVFQGFNQSWTSARQEDRRLQSELIIRAVEADEPEQALDNLQFLLDAGLIDDKDGEIQALIAAGEIAANFAAYGWKESEELNRIMLEMILGSGNGSGGSSGGPTEQR